MILGNLADDNANVRNAAFNALVDILRILTRKELNSLIIRVKEILNSKEQNEKNRTQASIALMAIVLTSPYEIEPWAEDIIKTILKHKKISKIIQEKIKDFFSRFWKTQKQSWHLNNITLNDDTIDRIKEISNPFSYFA